MKRFLLLTMCCALLAPIFLLGQTLSHPRIYITDNAKAAFLQSIEQTEWKKKLVEKKKENLKKYLQYCESDPNWLVAKLQMNWKTKHNKVFLKEGDFSHSEDTAPVPTVRFSGTRDWATDYKRPKLEDIQPYFDDARGMHLEHKKTGKMQWVHPSETGHIIEKINEQIMALAADAAFLYWLTGEQKYAALATPIFFTYMDGMHHRDAPIDLKNSNQQYISGLATFEVIHERIVVSLVTVYDFLHTYFKENNYRLENSVAVFQKWGDQIIKNGIPDNNWNLFQARFLTYIALVLEEDSNYENGKGKEYFLDHIFTTSTDRQLSIKESLLVYNQETGIWPESPSYSVHVITTLLRILTLLDHATNNNELKNYAIIEKAALASFQYLFPTGYTIGFGDAKHKVLPPENFELLIANYQKYNEVEKEKLISRLLDNMIGEKLYTRKASNFFQLFFYVDSLKKDTGNKKDNPLEKLTSPTFYASNVSMFNQRMGAADNAMMISTVGSYGNHAHANGISIELFANNYALGPDMGKGPSYWHPTHREFYARFPAHNTVIVDGKSDYAAMRTYNPFTLDNFFPALGKTPIFDKVTFSKVSFLEPSTLSNQQRFTALIKANSATGKGYILDVFRSRKQAEGKQKHEYVYHNLGQSLDFFDTNGKKLQLAATDELSSKNGDLKGYNYFTDKKKMVSSQDIRALFRLKSKGKRDNLMKVWIKGNENQSIFSVDSPKSNALSKGTAPVEILDNPLPTFILKRATACWTNPFAVVFNPYFEDGENPIENVTFSSLSEHPNTQIIEVLLQDKKTIDKIVLTVSENDIATDQSFYQKGLLSITRYSKSNNQLKYLFLSGMNRFEQDGWDIIASGEPFTCSIERSETGYVVHTDQPITINMPYGEEKQPAEIRLYKDGKMVSSRKGTKNRNNSKMLVFKLEKKYEKVEIIY